MTKLTPEQDAELVRIGQWVIETSDKELSLEARIERMEAMMVLLCEHAARGEGSLGKPFWQFIDDWRREHDSTRATVIPNCP